MNIIKKLRFLDYIIILIVILALIVANKFFNPNEKWITVEMLDENLPISQTQSIRVGDIEKNPTGKKTAEIIAYQILDTPGISNSNKDAVITAKLLVTITPYSEEYEYKNKIIKVGSPIELRFNQGLIAGVISDIDDVTSTKQATLILTIRQYAQWPWYTDSIKIGSTETDSNNKKIAEVIDKVVTPAQVAGETSSGQRVLTTDPQKVDMTLKVKVTAQQFGHRYVFRKNSTLLIGERISLNLGKTRLKDVSITDIE